MTAASLLLGLQPLFTFTSVKLGIIKYLSDACNGRDYSIWHRVYYSESRHATYRYIKIKWHTLPPITNK